MISALHPTAAKSWSDEPSSLSVRDVSKEFTSPSGEAIVALRGVTLSVAPGELLGLVGPSGCGKSTLLRMLAGLTRPTSGALEMDSRPITGPSAELGLIFQDPNLFPWLSVRRNIQAGLVARGLLHERRGDVEQLIHAVGLDAFAEHYPHQLSGGMAQRAALARALANHPRVLLLDEPLGALDQFTRMRMQDVVLDLREARRTTMVLVTHDVDEAIYMSDRIAIFTPRPGSIERIIPVPLPRPRQRNTPAFLQLRADILEMLHLAGGGK